MGFNFIKEEQTPRKIRKSETTFFFLLQIMFSSSHVFV